MPVLPTGRFGAAPWMAQMRQQSTPFPQIQGTQTNFTGQANAAIPQFSENASAASGIVNNLMTGKPAMDRTAAAYFGVGAGVPGSDFAANRAYDLFGKQREQRQQRGFEDFLAMLKTFSGSVMPTTGEALSSNLGVQRLAQDRAQAENQLMLQAAQQEEQQRRTAPREFSMATRHVGAGGTAIGSPNYSYRYFR